MTCATCTYADEHGWWGPDHRGTHCRICHRSWSGKAEAHCASCCRHFSRDSLALFHRRFPSACMDPAEVLRKDGTPVFALTERASGPVWVGAGEDSRWAS